MNENKIKWAAGLVGFLVLIFFIPVDWPAKLFSLIFLIPVFLVKLEVLPWNNTQTLRLGVAFKIFVVPLALMAVYGLSAGFYGIGITCAILTGLDIYLIIKQNKIVEETKERIKREAREEKEGDYGIEGFLSYEEFKELNDNDIDAGLLIGEFIMRNKEHAHITTIAPPGEGKGTTLIIPNLLAQWQCSNVVLDPKGENACITAGGRVAPNGKVFILDPWGLQDETGASHGIKPCVFDVFAMMRQDPDNLPDNCQMIAYYLVPDRKSEDSYFDDRARTIIKIYLLHMMTVRPEEEQNFWALYKLLRTSLMDLPVLLEEMENNPAYDGLIKAAAGEISTLMVSEKTYGSVMSSAHNATSIFESPQLRKALTPIKGSSVFNPYDLAKSPTTFYICVPERYLQSHAGFLKIVLTTCIKAVNAKPGIQVNFLVDEAGMLGKFDEIQRAYTFGRGQNIWMWTFWQTFGQIKSIYGEDGLNHLIGASKVIQAFGLTDPVSCEYISKMLGKRTRVTFEPPTREGEQGTYKSHDYDLMSPAEVAREKRMFAFTQGEKTLLHRIPYWEYPDEIKSKASHRPGQKPDQSNEENKEGNTDKDEAA